MADDDFYDAQSEVSQIKTRIVTKYFAFWARVMVPFAKRHGGRLAYFDLYAGPGRYQDGTPSTPLEILQTAIGNPDLCKMLLTYFNDSDPEHCADLEKNIDGLEGIDRLKHRPVVFNAEVDQDFETAFADIALVPSFSFVDPWGYKGVSLQLLHGMLKDWGCDLILFFSYNRINAAVSNPVFDEHTVGLFGESRLVRLRDMVEGKRPLEREALVLEAFTEALGDMGFEFVLPFTFKRPDMKRTSHHLVFVTKHPFAYTVMKEIMAAESSEASQGVPTFTYTKSLSSDETPLLYMLERPIDELGEMLLADFAGRTMRMKEIFEQHHVGRRFIERNYKAALIQLELDGKISTNPSKRRKGTFADHVQVTFPNR